MIALLVPVLLALFSCSDAGVTYVRWGRSVCPTGAHLLYKGYMAGSHWASGGNGGNYLCTPEIPKFVRPVAGRQDWTGFIVGIELEIINPAMKGLFLNDNVFGGDVYNQDLLCSVCYVGDSSAQFVMPGRQDCGDTGFDLQYKGFLVSEANVGRQRGQFTCLDEAPEGRPGGAGNDDNAVVYPVQIGCGSLPCNPYVDGFEMPCAVCSY